MDQQTQSTAALDARALEEKISRELLAGLVDTSASADALDVLASLDGTLFPMSDQTDETKSESSDETRPASGAQDELPVTHEADDTTAAQDESDAPQEETTLQTPPDQTRTQDADAPTKASVWPQRLFLATLAVCAAVSFAGLGARAYREQQLLQRDTMYRVSAGDVSLANLSRQEAAKALSDAFSDDRFDRPLRFTFEGKTFSAPLSKFEPHYDIDAALENAWRVGREGTRSERLLAIYAAQCVGAHTSVPCNVSRDAAEEYASSLAAQIDCDVQEPSVSVNPENNGVDNLFLTQEDVTGLRLDQSALADDICAVGENDFADIALAVEKTEPKQTLEALMENIQPLRTFTTEYAYVSSRVFNIHRATDTINGTVIQPGEEFSFNRIVGNTSLPENGYQAAGVIIGGRSAVDRGGGVCQAATTLYNAAVRCDMEITRRDPHAIASSYVPKGQDATIAYGAYDMAFRNTSDQPIYIFGSYTNTSVTFTIYGKPLADGISIEMESEMLGVRYPGEAKVTVDHSKPVGYRETTLSALSGYDVRVYKIWYDKDGNEIERVIDHEDAYPTRRAEITIGGAVPAAPPPPAVPPETPPETPPEE